MPHFPILALILVCSATSWAQEASAQAALTKTFQIEAGRRIPLSLMKTISTRSAAAGDPVYMTTVFPVMAGNRIVIPVGSYVSGSLTEVKRAGKVKGRAELRMRLETLILPNGVTHDFRGNLGGADSPNIGKFDREEGAIVGKGGKMDDLRTVATLGGVGGMVGGAAGGLATIGQSSPADSSGVRQYSNLIRRPIIGSSAGMAGGLAVGLIATLLTRGSDLELARGTDLDMVLDRTVIFDDSELVGLPAPPPGVPVEPAAAEPGLKQRPSQQ
jgi:type IV secretion system protein VirB10